LTKKTVKSADMCIGADTFLHRRPTAARANSPLRQAEIQLIEYCVTGQVAWMMM
jgi:hypothetical protein